MPFSHHSHSGQFCGHAVNTLEEVVQRAIAVKMTTFCLTEHMPRTAIDIYPEEAAHHTEASLAALYDAFYAEARRLQAAYADRITLLVGFEGEWIRPESLTLIRDLLAKFPVDLFLGSLHHVHSIPIDYDHALYFKAREVAGGTDERIFEDYFDSQLEMLQALRPPIVGHFDLIRLKSDDPERSFRTWPNVWAKLERNLQFIASYGGVLELNSASLRKGMSEAYPQSEICKVFKNLGGRFTLADDSHGCDQVGMNYHRVLPTLDRAGIDELLCLAPVSESITINDDRFPTVGWKRIPVTEVKANAFFKVGS